MLHLERKEYDLNMLLNFEMLKEILIKLAKSQDKLEDEIKNINHINSKRDKIIIKLEKEIFNTSNYADEKDQNKFIINNNEEKELDRDRDDQNIYNEQKENENIIKDKEITNEYSIKNDINENIKFNKDNEINNEEIQKKDNEQNDLNKINNNQIFSRNKKISEKKLMEKKISDKNVYMNNNNSNQQSEPNPKDQSSSMLSAISPDLFTKMMKQLKEQHSQIIILENKLQSESENIKNVQSQLKNHILDNESEIKLINERINSILQKNEDYEQKIENLQVKSSELDVFSMFKDSGDGTIDSTKVMIKALEEKIFKKFELVDARYKKDSLDNLKVKTNVENITPKLEQFHRDLERINDLNKQQKDDLDNYKKENEKINLDNMNNIYNDVNQKLLELKDEIEKDLKNKLLLFENQLKNIKINNNDNNTFDILKLGLGNNGLDSEAAQALEKKINDLRKKTNDIENTLKLYMNNIQETDLIKKEIKDIKLLLDKKISKDDLKELYNFHLSDVDEINDIKDRESITYDELRKTIKDLQNVQQRIESINGNLALLQNNPSNGNMKIIDFSKYIDNQKLNETLKPFFKEFEKLYKEMDTFKKDINNIDNQCKNNIKNNINKLDEDINNKLNELKSFIQKRYLEKFDFSKTIKSIEVQIKSLTDDPKKSDADNWLLAKKPLKCFNCASCEANIKNDNYNTAEYLPWKKYPRGDKIHRMGQGFSHMLQMMTSEFIKSIEKNEFPLESELNSKNINNNNSQINDKSTITGFVVNNKEQIQEDGFQNLKKSKMKLPKVKQYSKPKIKKYEENLPISDDEIIENNIENNKELVTKNNSPKILKITKKTKQKMDDKKNKNIYGNLMTMPGGLTPRDNTYGFNRNNILKTDKNEFLASLNSTPK